MCNTALFCTRLLICRKSSFLCCYTVVNDMAFRVDNTCMEKPLDFCLFRNQGAWNISMIMGLASCFAMIFYHKLDNGSTEFFDMLLWLNSVAPGRFEWNFMQQIFMWIKASDDWGTSCEITPRGMQDLTGDYSILIQVMAWCLHALAVR